MEKYYVNSSTECTTLKRDRTTTEIARGRSNDSHRRGCFRVIRILRLGNSLGWNGTSLRQGKIGIPPPPVPIVQGRISVLSSGDNLSTNVHRKPLNQNHRKNHPSRRHHVSFTTTSAVQQRGKEFTSKHGTARNGHTYSN